MMAPYTVRNTVYLSSSKRINFTDRAQVDRITVKFESNRSFLQHPSYETEGLWKTLYPKDTHGLFEYPDENPERAGFAAFHQLHCVVRV